MLPSRRTLSARFVFLFIATVPCTAPAIASDRDSDGLPRSLPGDYLQRIRLIPLPHAQDGAFPVPAAAIEVNGKKDFTGGRAVFEEQAYAQLPPGEAIETRADPTTGKVLWTYPVGAESVHELRFQATEPTPFELRVARLIRPGRWAAGSYQWVGGQWELNEYEGLKPEAFQVQHPHFGSVRITLKRINLRSCKGCHATNVDPVQFPTRAETGPCGFVPENPLIQTTWAETFLTRLGEQPFRPSSIR